MFENIVAQKPTIVLADEQKMADMGYVGIRDLSVLMFSDPNLSKKCHDYGLDRQEYRQFVLEWAEFA